MRVKCLAQEHDTMSPAKTRTRTTRSVVERTNHRATTPPEDYKSGRNFGMRSKDNNKSLEAVDKFTYLPGEIDNRGFSLTSANYATTTTTTRFFVL